ARRKSPRFRTWGCSALRHRYRSMAVNHVRCGAHLEAQPLIQSQRAQVGGLRPYAQTRGPTTAVCRIADHGASHALLAMGRSHRDQIDDERSVWRLEQLKKARHLAAVLHDHHVVTPLATKEIGRPLGFDLVSQSQRDPGVEMEAGQSESLPGN